MDDNSSVTSFEEVVPSGIVVRPEVGNLADGPGDRGSSPDSDEDPPDVLYVLMYEKFGKQIEIQRSAEPITVTPGQDANSSSGQGTRKKPVIEIVTVVSTSWQATGRPSPTPPARHPRRGRRHPAIIDDYDYGFAYNEGIPPAPPHGHNMKVTKVRNKVMTIHSLHLRNALQAVVGYYPGASFVGDEVRIEAPYHVLVHHREVLARYRYQQPESHDEEYMSTTAKHIDVLLGFLEHTFGDRIREEEKRYSQATPSATFDNLWLLLKPGEVIYAQHDGNWAPFVVSRVWLHGSPDVDGQIYAVDCWNYMYSDRAFLRFMHCFDIPSFSGEEAIDELSVVPERFFTGAERDQTSSEARDEQVRLGKLVWEYCTTPTYKQYSGDMVKKSPYAGVVWAACPTGYMSGRVIIDCEGYERWAESTPPRVVRPARPAYPPQRPEPPLDQLPTFAPCCGCLACNTSDRVKDLSQWCDFQELSPQSDDAPELDLYYIALSKVVAGFMLGERRWAHFHVEGLEDIEFDKDAFNSLVLDSDIKTTLRALIRKFSNENGQVSAWPNDFVKNKGQGRIFLLHGSPGVGKTCTAECIAELTQRPLLSLTSGDLSTNSNLVERNLEYFLQLGERFGAMVLLDEADVYLESRRSKDIARNGLVSVFLRALEYYRGVLFLTTNRVQTFDAAFTSRIHVALHYGPLTDTDRERIWNNGFERLERDAGGRVRVAKLARMYVWESSDVRALRWNGREIRNALQTAVALAENEALDLGAATVLVTERHLQSVVRMSRGFKNFMHLRLHDDEDAGERGMGVVDVPVVENAEDDDEEGDEEPDDDDQSIELSSGGYRYPPEIM